MSKIYRDKGASKKATKSQNPNAILDRFGSKPDKSHLLKKLKEIADKRRAKND